MNLFKKKVLTGGLVSFLLLSGGVSVALAESPNAEPSFGVMATTFTPFALTVPGNNVNDARGETANQKKTTSNALAGLKLQSSGGSKLDVRTELSGGSGAGSWKYGVIANNTYSIDSPQQAGQYIHLQFSTDLFQGPVAITGEWRSN